VTSTGTRVRPARGAAVDQEQVALVAAIGLTDLAFGRRGRPGRPIAETVEGTEAENYGHDHDAYHENSPPGHCSNSPIGPP
jgi:hypothetical protein